MHFHIVKRDSCPFWKKLCLYLAAVAAALVLGGLLLLVMGVDPIAYYQRMFTMGMVGNKIAYKTFENYLKVFVPLVLTSVALSLAFKMRFWNIGGEGQFILGAVAAAAVALKLKDSLPQGVVLILMCLAGMAAAGVYGALAAVLKVKFGTNETLMTLMLNYVALYFLIFLGETQAEWNFFLDTSSARPVFFNFGKEVAFPRIMIGKFGLNVCVLLTLLIGVLVYCYLKYSKHGYEIAVVGDSPNTARSLRRDEGECHRPAHRVPVGLPHRPGCRLQGGDSGHPLHLLHRRCGLDGGHRGLAGPAEHRDHLCGVRPDLHASARVHRGRRHLCTGGLQLCGYAPGGHPVPGAGR